VCWKSLPICLTSSPTTSGVLDTLYNPFWSAPSANQLPSVGLTRRSTTSNSLVKRLTTCRAWAVTASTPCEPIHQWEPGVAPWHRWAKHSLWANPPMRTRCRSLTPLSQANHLHCDVPRLDVLNTANLCPAVSVVGLLYLLTVMYTFVWFGTLVHFRCEVY